MCCLQDNDLEREFQVHRTESDYALAEFWKWAISCAIGVAMGCIGFLVDLGINLLNDIKYSSTVDVILKKGGRTGCLRRRGPQAATACLEEQPWICCAPGLLGLRPGGLMY